MNLAEAFMEKKFSKKQCNIIVEYIGDNKERFAALMELFFEGGGGYRITQRASWPMSYCVRNYPSLILPYYKLLIDNLSKKDVLPALTRNTVCLLQDVEIPKKFHGKVMGICFDFIQSNTSAIAVKVFSLSILQNLSKQYPEIIPEVKLIIEERWQHETAAFKSRAKRFLKSVEKKH